MRPIKEYIFSRHPEPAGGQQIFRLCRPTRYTDTQSSSGLIVAVVASQIAELAINSCCLCLEKAFGQAQHRRRSFDGRLAVKHSRRKAYCSIVITQDKTRAPMQIGRTPARVASHTYTHALECGGTNKTRSVTNMPRGESSRPNRVCFVQVCPPTDCWAT